MSSSSPRESGTDSTVVVGLVRSPNGLHGDVHVELLSDVPGRFSEGRQVLIGNSTFTILRVRQQAKRLIVRFNDVGSREEAEKLRNSYISIDIGQVPPPPPATYYFFSSRVVLISLFVLLTGRQPSLPAPMYRQSSPCANVQAVLALSLIHI